MSRTFRFGGLRDGSKACPGWEPGFEGLRLWWWRWGSHDGPPGPTKRHLARLTGDRDRIPSKRKRMTWIAIWMDRPLVGQPPPRVCWEHATSKERAEAALKRRKGGAAYGLVSSVNAIRRATVRAYRLDEVWPRSFYGPGDGAKQIMMEQAEQASNLATTAMEQALFWEREGIHQVASQLREVAARMADEARCSYPHLDGRRIELCLQACQMLPHRPRLFHRLGALSAALWGLGLEMRGGVWPGEAELEAALEWHEKRGWGGPARELAAIYRGLSSPEVSLL